MKKKTAAVLLIPPAALVLLSILLIAAGIENAPLTAEQNLLTFDSIEKTKNIIKRIKPTHLEKSSTQTIALTEKESNLLLAYALSQIPGRHAIRSEIRFLHNRAVSLISVPVPETFLGRYINLTAALIPGTGPDHRDRQAVFSLESLRLGRVTIPGAIISAPVRLGHTLLMKTKIYRQVFEPVRHIRNIRIEKNRMVLTYFWQPDTLKRLHETGKDILLSREHKKRLIVYHSTLMEILGRVPQKKISLGPVLSGMFTRAADRTRKSGDAVRENTALLQVLAVYATGRGIDAIIPENQLPDMPSPVFGKLLLTRRTDLARHFLISAGIAVSAGSRLADLIGIAKEVDDSDAGSGFSFADLAADKAGVALARLATRSGPSAQQVQRLMAGFVDESYFMPDIDHLSEGITRLQFKKHLKDLDSPSYTLITDEIQARLNACGLHRDQ